MQIRQCSRALLPALFVAASASAHAAFTAGDLAVLKADSSSLNNTTITILELNPNDAAQTPTSSISISGTTSDGLRLSGSATSTGYLSHTDDRTLITFTGANSTNTSSNANTLNPRGVGVLDSSGNYSLATTYTGASGNQTRSAASLNDSDWFIGDQGGIYTNGSSSASPSGNFRSVKPFGGTVYAFIASASSPPVGTLASTTGSTYTGLPGLANGTGNAQDFYLVQSGANGSTYDELYVLSASSGSAGSIQKFSLVSGSWTANGTAATTFGGFGLAAAADPTAGTDLYVTTGTGSSGSNKLLKLIDGAGFNTNITITNLTGVTLYTAPTGTTLKGVDFAPIPEPAGLGMLLCAAGVLFTRRRSHQAAH